MSKKPCPDCGKPIRKQSPRCRACYVKSCKKLDLDAAIAMRAEGLTHKQISAKTGASIATIERAFAQARREKRMVPCPDCGQSMMNTSERCRDCFNNSESRLKKITEFAQKNATWREGWPRHPEQIKVDDPLETRLRKGAYWADYFQSGRELEAVPPVAADEISAISSPTGGASSGVPSLLEVVG